MKATRVQIDTDFQDDGLYAATLWVDETPPRYISLSRDELESPDVVYVEAEDQKYGFSTKDIRVSWSGNVLRLGRPATVPWKFHWTADDAVLIEIPEADVAALKALLARVLEIGRSLKD